jgi:hypothetical protein
MRRPAVMREQNKVVRPYRNKLRAGSTEKAPCWDFSDVSASSSNVLTLLYCIHADETTADTMFEPPPEVTMSFATATFTCDDVVTIILR